MKLNFCCVIFNRGSVRSIFITLYIFCIYKKRILEKKLTSKLLEMKVIGLFLTKMLLIIIMDRYEGNEGWNEDRS